MKALSIRQPWAWAIVNGYKPVENRSWPTRFRGRFLVHAGVQFDHDGYAWLQERRQYLGLPELPAPPVSRRDRKNYSPGEFPMGGFVGEAELHDCTFIGDYRVGAGGTWFFGPYGFWLRNAKPTEFRPAPGALSFFTVD